MGVKSNQPGRSFREYCYESGNGERIERRTETEVCSECLVVTIVRLIIPTVIDKYNIAVKCTVMSYTESDQTIISELKTCFA